jgi:hypothetical protein
MTITTEDREALLREHILVHSVHVDAFGTRLYATGPDRAVAKDALIARLGDAVDIEICGETPREVRPRACCGHMEREPGRLQLRYCVQEDEHVDLIFVAEDDERVVVFGTVCTPIDLLPGHEWDSPYHVYLDRPLAGREVFDAVQNAPVPYFNVYDGIKERVAAERRLGRA